MNNGAKGFFTVRNVLIGLALICLTLVFLPMFVARSYGTYFFISNFSIMFGRTALFIDKVGKAFPVAILSIFVAIGLVVVPFIRALNNKITSIILLALAGTDIPLLVILAIVGWKRYRYYSRLRFSGFFAFDCLVLIVIIAISVLLLLNRTALDSAFTDIFTKGAGRQAFDKVTSAVDRATDSVINGVGDAPRREYIGFCAKCGNKIVYGSTFCTVCGTAVPQSVIDEGELIHEENMKRAAEEAARREEQRKAAEAERARREAERRAAQEAARAEAARRAEERARMEAERRAAMEQQRVAAMQQQAAQNAAAYTAPVVTPALAPAPQPQDQPKFCQQCGTKAVPGSMFCENCGAKLV